MITFKVTLGSLITSLSKALHPRLLCFVGQPDLVRLFAVPDFFHLRMMKAIMLLGIFNTEEIFLYPFSDLS